MTGNRVPLSVKITIYHNVHEDAFFGLNAVRLPGGGTRQATAAERPRWSRCLPTTGTA